MHVIRKDEGERRQGTAFTGETTLEEIVTLQRPGGLRIAIVRFSDGALTYWHTHPGEQVLYVLEGEGRMKTADDEDEVTLHPGDAVYAPPGELHWHGAAPGSDMVHISVTTIGPPEWHGAPE
jgi:quercetin dioxygenase-like cupin family protein